MRFKMIGYGKYRYAARSGILVEWPVIGVVLQKNYVSVYVSVTKDGASIVRSYAGTLGELRSGNNFSFEKFDDLKVPAVSSPFAEVAAIFAADPENPSATGKAAEASDVATGVGLTPSDKAERPPRGAGA